MIGPADLREELYGLIGRLSATRGLDNVLDEVLQAAMTLTGSEMGTISPISASTRSSGKPIYRGFPTDYVEHMAEHREPVKDGPRERAFLSGRQVLIPDVFEDPAFTPFLPWVRRAGFISMQATPIFSRDRDPVGVICTFQRTQHTPASEHLGLLDLYAKLAGDAIEREYAESSLRDREENLQCLYELMIGLAGARTLDDALHEVLSAAIGLVGADAGHIRLRDPESGKLRLAADTGFKEDFLLRHGDRARKFLSRSPSIDAIVQGRRIVVEDLDTYPPFEPHRDILAAEGYRSLRATPPIGHAGEAIGSVTTFCTGRHVPTATQLQVLDLYARLAAEAIERMRTEDALRVSEERLRLATQGAKVYPWELDLTSQRVWYDGNLKALQAPPPGSHARRILALIHPEDRGALLRTFR